MKGPFFMKRHEFSPDETQRDDAPYWAAALVLAVREGDRKRIAEARRQLKRLGYAVDLSKQVDRKGAADAR
jgi:hypothetical protein